MNILTTNQAKKIKGTVVKRLANYIKDNNIKSIVLGISGGIDSSVVAILGLLTRQELKRKGYRLDYHYLFLDCDSDKFDLKKATVLANKFKFKLDRIGLTKWYESSPLLGKIPKDHAKSRIAKGNIKCRLRMISLYHFAQLENGIYLDTDDLSEEFMGFWTKHGDEGDVKIIQHFTKEETYDLGEYLGIPKEILNSPPGDGLGVTLANHASDQLGMDYLATDYIISRFIQNDFDINGSFNQLKVPIFIKLINLVAEETKQSPKSVTLVLSQALRTGFKRKYGDNVAHLLPDRREFGLPNIGTDKFNSLYHHAIIKKIQKDKSEALR